MAPPPLSGDDGFVGVFMVEQPPDWWLPEGYSLASNGTAPIAATDPLGNQREIYADPGYRPSPERIEAIADVVERELGPMPTQGIGPQTRRALGMDRDDALGAINRTIMYPVDMVAYLLDLANYGLDAAIVGGTEGMRRAGWVDETEAGQLRRDLMLLSLVVGVETGRAPEALDGRVGAAQFRAATVARAAAKVLPPVVLRAERATGIPFGRVFRVVDVVEADPPAPWAAAQGRVVQGWISRVRAGRDFDRIRAREYRFNQVYVVKDGGTGYWILDSYGPYDPALGGGPVSRKLTQLADIRVESATAMLQEAYRKYRPGQMLADVRSRSRDLRDTVIQGQLWLEVPVQTQPIPAAVLASAKRLSIKIREVSGKIYE